MFQFGGFNVSFPDAMRNFLASYKCFSIAMLPGNERQDVEKGGKIIMPPSALNTLTKQNVDYPMLFKLHNYKKKRISHAGVLEFVADEGKCYLPYWMMDNLLLEEGDVIIVESVSLPVATYSKFQSQTTDFLDITNPKAVLENALRNFACLTNGDVIAIPYNRKVYELSVLETRPGNAVSIIECDMNVEFETPVGYKDSQQTKFSEEPMEEDRHVMKDVIETFTGLGLRLDGKKIKNVQIKNPIIEKTLAHGVPDYEYKFGVLKFDRSIKPITDRIPKMNTNNVVNPNSFQGKGFNIKQ